MYRSTYETIKDGQWFRANFHTHAGVCTKGQCGILPVDDVVDAYKNAGCNVLAISNHDRYIPREKNYEGISVIDAVEYSANPHMLLIGVNEYHNVPHQEAINRAVSAGGFVILCHPNWQHREYFPDSLIDELTGYTGLEITNGVVHNLTGSGLALDSWDNILSKGRKVWGFGNDDFHHYRDTGRVYNMICAKSGSYNDIREAVTAGRFYVSSGVMLKEFALENDELYVKAGYFRDTYISNFEYKITGARGRILLKTEGESISLKLNGEPYVRVEATSDYGAKMYLQPIFRE